LFEFLAGRARLTSEPGSKKTFRSRNAASGAALKRTLRICREILGQEEATAGSLERYLPEVARQYLRRDRTGAPARRWPAVRSRAEI
jgi:hypothetical protein